MSNQGCCVNNHESQQEVIKLWLQTEEDDEKKVCPDKEPKEHADADLVLITAPPKMQASENGKGKDKEKSDHLMTAERREVERHLEVTEDFEMGHQSFWIILVEIPAEQKPIRCYDTHE